MLKKKKNESYWRAPRDPNNPYSTRFQYVRNPFFREKDPVKSMINNGTDGSGRPIFMKNPLARPSGFGYSNTAQGLINSPWNPGNIDPWYE